MTVMIKLRLPVRPTDLDSVQKLHGLKGLVLDSRFGVVCISPKDGLYVVRTDEIDNLDERRRLSPEILDAYGDQSISTAWFHSSKNPRCPNPFAFSSSIVPPL